MKNVDTIINLFGGLDRLADHPLRIEVDGFMPLCIELVGSGPRGGALLSVMHVHVQHGDVMRDPDIEVEIMPDGRWLPVSYRQDNLGLHYYVVEHKRNGLVVRRKLVDDLIEFMSLWDTNLGQQGFVEAARTMAPAVHTAKR